MNYRRGEVFWITLTGTGSEQSGRRPVVIVQNDRGNRNSPVTTIAIITSAPNKPFPFTVPVAGEAGLKAGSVVNCAHLYTVDASRLQSFQGRLSGQTMDRVADALRYQLDL